MAKKINSNPICFEECRFSLNLDDYEYQLKDKNDSYTITYFIKGEVQKQYNNFRLWLNVNII